MSTPDLASWLCVLIVTTDFTLLTSLSHQEALRQESCGQRVCGQEVWGQKVCPVHL